MTTLASGPFVLVSKVPSVPLLVLIGLLSRKTDDRTLLLNDGTVLLYSTTVSEFIVDPFLSATCS